jgi:hypothetical protein
MSDRSRPTLDAERIMMVAPQLEADFYLLGYNIAAYKRYYSYWKDYDYGDRDENDVIQRAALYHLSQMRDGFKRASEDLALELGIRLSDIFPENYDPQLEAMNELEGRSAAGDFIRRRFGKELHAAFKRGGYVGGEIGYCYELAKAALAEAKSVAHGKETLLMLLEMKLAEFEKDVDKVPSEVADVVSGPALRHAISVIKEATPDDLDELATMMETFFGVYEQLTEHYRSVRDRETSPEENSELYFLSYTHRNRIKADQIEIHLLRQHRQVWRDETDLRAGQKLLSNLYHGIEDAHVFVCVITGAYVQSRYCMAELERAVRRELETGRPRVVILKADRKCEIPRIVADHVWIDVDIEAKLALAIARLLGQ